MARMDHASLTALVSEMEAIRAATYEGEDPCGIEDKLSDPTLFSVPTLLYRDQQDALVGFNMMPARTLQVRGRKVTVLGSTAALMPSHRGKGLTQTAGIAMAYRLALQRPLRRAFVACTFMQPRVYEMFASLTRYFYPRFDAPTPRLESHVLEHLARLDGGYRITSTGAVLKQFAGGVRATARERAGCSGAVSAHVRYFRRQAPDWESGEGMLVLLPLHVGVVASAGLRMLARSMRRRLPRGGRG